MRTARMAGTKEMVLAAIVTLTSGQVSAQSLRRSPNAEHPAPNAPRGAVTIPRYPYAGAWEGSLIVGDASTDERRLRVTMTFALASAETQAYSGVTLIEGRGPSLHLDLENERASDRIQQVEPARGSVLPRNRGDDRLGLGPSVGDGGRAGNGDNSHALLVNHFRYGPLLCDPSHRCADMPVLRWEERRGGGEIWKYSARLEAADSIAGTVTIAFNGVEKSRGRLVLHRSR